MDYVKGLLTVLAPIVGMVIAVMVVYAATRMVMPVSAS